nr:MAG TPA: hypothetical protein [Caudoviricetes sp.]
MSLRRSVSGMMMGVVTSSTCMRLPARFMTAVLSLLAVLAVSWSPVTR